MKSKKKLLLFYFKKTRDASDILEEQNKNIMVDEEKFGKMQKMKAITLKMYEELKDGKTENFGEALHESWMLKKSLANKISSSYIDSLYERARKAGAIGGKIFGGGGGGGFFLYFLGDKKEQRGVGKLGERFWGAGGGVFFFLFGGKKKKKTPPPPAPKTFPPNCTSLS